jgi:hypothetical protein
MINEKRLTEAITEGGIPWINFFNGRLLSGEDLSKEQTSNLEGRRRLGRAIGEGVATGLEVSLTEGVDTRETPIVTVNAGLAINRQGQTLSLNSSTNVKLTRPINVASNGRTAFGFDDCKPLQPGIYIALAGVYLLTIAPATKNEGRAAVSGLDNIVARCNTHHAVEGVQFRLIQLGINAEEMRDAAYLRNRIAYRCFGIDSGITFPVDPFNAPPPRTLLDDLRPRLLTDCDVPLAIINWTSTEGIKFVDNWSVRRRVFAPSAAGQWETVLGERRRSEGEAMFLQFQEHLEALARQTAPRTLVAAQHLNYLPPIGIIPHTDSLSGDGFDYRAFFGGLTYREPVFIEGAKVEPLFRRSLAYAPTDLNTGEMIWLYWVRQNMKTIDNNPARPPRAYLIFTSGHVPYQGQAQFDLGHWEYANYAI